MYQKSILLAFLSSLAAALPQLLPSQDPQLQAKMSQFVGCARLRVADVGSNTTSSFLSPDSQEYELYSTGDRPRVPRAPLAIYMPMTEEEIIKAVQCAHKMNLQVVPRGGGHSYEGFSSQDGAIVLDLSMHREVKIVSTRGNDGTATVGGGARLGNVYIALSKDGFNYNAGTCPSVGIGGHVGGGGYGMLARLKGLAADQVIGMRVVLSDGKLVRANAQENADLFWALRGGNAGSFGVVTEYTINIFKTPQVTMFKIHYEPTVENFVTVANAWMKSYYNVDKRLTCQLNMRSDRFELIGQFTGPKTDAQSVLVKSGMTDESLSIQTITINDKCSLVGIKAFIPTGGCGPTLADDMKVVSAAPHNTNKDYGKYKADYFSAPIPIVGLQKIANSVMNSPEFSWIQFEVLGGAVSEKPDSATPYSNRKSKFSVQYAVALQPGEETTSPNWEWIRSIEQEFQPFANGNHYQNYPDIDLGPNYGVAYYGAANFERLKTIKAKYDPKNNFRNEQSIPLPGAAPAAAAEVEPAEPAAVASAPLPLDDSDPFQDANALLD